MSKEPEECVTPGSVPGAVVEEELMCVLCGKKMFFAKDFQVHVCLDKDHGVLAYYSLDKCYFTSREEIGLRFLKEGKKFHMIEPEVLKMIGVES